MTWWCLEPEMPWATCLEKYRQLYERLQTDHAAHQYSDILGVLRREGKLQKWPVISRNDEQQALYVALRMDGMSHPLAEMLALQSPPMSNTDREFLEGRGGCYDQFKGQQEVGDYYSRLARGAGVDTTGKVYLSGLAAYPGDPRAWVSGRGDVKKVCEERGWSCDGSVKVKGEVRVDTWGKYEVAPDIVRERAQDLMDSGSARDQEEATDKAREALSPRATQHPKEV